MVNVETLSRRVSYVVDGKTGVQAVSVGVSAELQEVTRLGGEGMAKENNLY